MLAQRMKLIEESKTSGLNAKIKHLKAEGQAIINFAAGELDFDTSEIIKDKTKEAIDRGLTHYTDTMGIAPLRKLIAADISNTTGMHYSPEEVGITAGAKQALFNVIMAIVNPDDEVIIPSPYWVTFPEQVKLAGGVPVFLDTKAFDYTINLEKLEQLISAKTRAIIINSPHNPTGTVIDQKTLAAISQLAEKNNIWIIYDECYSKFVFSPYQHHCNIKNEADKNRTIIINSFSKSSAVTGWRIGYMCGPKSIITAANKLQSHVSSNPCSIAQYGMIGAFTPEHQHHLNDVMRELHARLELTIAGLKTIPAISYHLPQGAFYVFIEIKNLLGRKFKENIIHSTQDFAEFLLEHERVAVIPGEAFNDPSCIRISFALSKEDISKGIEGMKNFITQIK